MLIGKEEIVFILRVKLELQLNSAFFKELK